MKNLILLTSMIFLLFSCNKKEEETQPVQKIEKEFIEDSLVYEVVNAVLEMPEIKEYEVEYMLNFANPDLVDLERVEEKFYRYAEKYFGEVDTVSINNQIKKFRYSYYQKGQINNIELIDYDFINMNINHKLDSLNQSLEKYSPHVTISFPIFNKEKNVAFMSYLYECGFLCAHSKKFFIKKINGKWEIIFVYDEYIS
ncbi:MAG TPA: hypothetical protein VKY32_06790 [Flavobacterium sp.]|nr:hypothetical protein [Flavobacterium sp.]